jgi:hypothetical protein
MLEFSVENLQKIKTAIHIAQAVFIFPAWCLVIAVYRSDAVSRGPLHWYFAVVCFAIPKSGVRSIGTDSHQIVFPVHPRDYLPFHDLGLPPVTEMGKRLRICYH